MHSSSQYRCGNGPVAHLAKEQVEGLLIPIVLAAGNPKGYHLRTNSVILRKASFFSSNTCSPTTLLISPSFLLGYLVQLEVTTGRPLVGHRHSASIGAFLDLSWTTGPQPRLFHPTSGFERSQQGRPLGRTSSEL